MWWKHKNPASTSAETPFGVFVKDNDIWEGWWTTGDSQLRIWTRDIDGEPDRAFFIRLHAILDDLPVLEQIARQNVDGLSDAHHLAGISDTEDPEEFTLDFDYEAAGWSEIVRVWFQGRQVTGWSSID